MRTPTLSVHDPRTLAARQVAYLRKVVNGPLETLITRQRHDVAGRLLEQSDPRLFGIVPNLSTVYRLSGEPLKVDSVDTGWRLSLVGPAGEELQRWDQRCNHWRIAYDNQIRPVTVEENDQPNVESYTYADHLGDPAHNRRGQMIEQVDRSGTLSFDSYGLLGQPLRETRTLVEGKPYRTSRIYSPLGTLLSQTDAGDHQQQSRYDITGQLKQVELRIKGSPIWQPVLKNAQYNAATQIIEQRAGNEVLSTWTYDPVDGRLSMQRAQKNAEPALQDLEYFYDRVGNITRLEDHTFQPIYFANQLIDGHRDFTYDSLYRLTRATGYDDTLPSDVPGRPLPGDPNNRLIYQQDYEYDHGGNLIRLRHVRAGASHTREMFIDPASNRGVRWKPGDPIPDFEKLFDRHGNLQNLQPGKALPWNSLDQLESVTLVKRANGPNDEEFYRYSQGVRVYKRHQTHTPSLTHFQEVIYLPGLEIRTRDSGEELHVITLPGGHGSVRCLHWVTGKPANIAADQLRYSLDDHLGSCAIELDQDAQVISQEGYYPFGATAWFARGSEVDVDYKTIRYSGKEMDDSGLYYYGARYYAPWLQRWVSADPAGDVDGLNLYGFVGNSPLRYFDNTGSTKEESADRQQIAQYAKTLSTVNSEIKKLNYQLYNFTRTRDIYKTAAKKLAFSVVSFAVTANAGAVGATLGAGAASVTGPAAPIVAPVAAAIGGIFFADAAGKVMDKLGDETGLGYTITPDAFGLSVKNIKSKSTAEPFSVKAVANSFNPKTSDGLTKTAIETTTRVVGKHLRVPYLKQALAIVRQASQLTEALNGAFGQGDLDKISTNLDALDSYLDKEEALALAAFERLQDAPDESPKLIGAANMPMRSDATELPTLLQEMKVARSSIKQARNLVGRVSQHLVEKRAA